jgi:anti-sigma regulatory factor (Ser/Thr protein kinase)/predicted GIY-YIG superfamily endonuclease
MISAIWKDKLSSLPQAPGVYLMRDAGGVIIYIGKAKNLKKRVSSYFRSDAEDKAVAIVSALSRLDYILASSEREALILERQLIADWQPYFNVMWKDGKTYPYLKLTMNEDFPRLVLTRSPRGKGEEYFGPYPQVQQIKRLQRWKQRVFKWRPCRLEFSTDTLPPEPKVKSCLYYHTERCPGPCMGRISREEYRKTIEAATAGKLIICDRHEIEALAGQAIASCEIRSSADLGAIRRIVAEVAQSVHMDEPRVYDLILCVGESTTNVIKHADGGTASVHRHGDSLLVVISDNGPGIPDLALPEVALKKGYSTAVSLGMGYKAMISIADHVYLATGPDGTIVAIEMKLHPPKPPGILEGLPNTW